MRVDPQFEGASARSPARRVPVAGVALLSGLLVVAAPGEARADPATTTPEQGFDTGEVFAPRTVAMGGAQVATGTSTSGLWLNPANLPFSRVYHFEALGAVAPEARRQSYGGAVVDSITNRLSGGFGGVWSMQDPEGMHRTWTDLRLALAFPLGDRFALGATARYLRVEQGTGRGPLGASLASDGTVNGAVLSLVTVDVGATLSITDGLRVGLLGRNLTAPGTALAPVVLGGGIGYTTSLFSLEADAFADLNTWGKPVARVGVGGEVFVAGHVPIRLGYRYDDGQRAHAVSGGIGYVDTKFSVEAAVRRDLAAERPATVVALTLRYFYDTAKTSPDEPDQF